jgi:hypothetical protein
VDTLLELVRCMAETESLSKDAARNKIAQAARSGVKWEKKK